MVPQTCTLCKLGFSFMEIIFITLLHMTYVHVFKISSLKIKANFLCNLSQISKLFVSPISLSPCFLTRHMKSLIRAFCLLPMLNLQIFNLLSTLLDLVSPFFSTWKKKPQDLVRAQIFYPVARITCIYCCNSSAMPEVAESTSSNKL